MSSPALQPLVHAASVFLFLNTYFLLRKVSNDDIVENRIDHIESVIVRFLKRVIDGNEKRVSIILNWQTYN